MTSIVFGAGSLVPLNRLPEELGVLNQKTGSDLPMTTLDDFFFSLFYTVLALTMVESQVQGFIEREFRAQKATLNLDINTTTTGTQRWVYRRNGSDLSGSQITVPNGMTGVFTKNLSQIVDSGDLIDVCVSSRGGGTTQYWNYNMEIDIFLPLSV